MRQGRERISPPLRGERIAVRGDSRLAPDWDRIRGLSRVPTPPARIGLFAPASFRAHSAAERNPALALRLPRMPLSPQTVDCPEGTQLQGERRIWRHSAEVQ